MIGPVVDTGRVIEAFVAEGLITAEEAACWDRARKTVESTAILDRILRDHDGLLRVNKRLGMLLPAPCDTPPRPKPTITVGNPITDYANLLKPAPPVKREPDPIPTPGPDDLCPPRQRRRRERARLRAQGGAS